MKCVQSVLFAQWCLSSWSRICPKVSFLLLNPEPGQVRPALHSIFFCFFDVLTVESCLCVFFGLFGHLFLDRISSIPSFFLIVMGLSKLQKCHLIKHPNTTQVKLFYHNHLEKLKILVQIIHKDFLNDISSWENLLHQTGICRCSKMVSTTPTELWTDSHYCFETVKWVGGYKA